jgi:serine/threonine protein kinase/Tol biopolymer transport system component
MTDVQWKRVWDLYEVAQTLPPDEASRFLATLSDDSAVIAEVRSLLVNLADQGALSEPSRIGERVGPYKVLQWIGRGASAEVYAGLDTRLQRPVALKFLNSSSESATRRFLREAQSISALNHPNILTVFEVLESADGPVLVTELVEGGLLREHCAAPLPESKVLRIGLQIARALEAAHARGFIHRDLKPENVMLRPDGYVKVLDFGLVRHLFGDAANLTSMAGLPVGTLRYMSPEQCQGQPLTPASDLFALGLILYELIAGRHPFAEAAGLEVASAIVSGNPAPPMAASPELRRLILQLLSKTPQARPGTSEVVARLDELGGVYSSTRDSRPHPVLPVKGGGPLTRRLWAAGALAAAAGAGAAAYFWRRPQPASVTLVSGGLIRDPVFSPDGTRAAFSWQRDKSSGFQIFVTALPDGDPKPLTVGPREDYDPAWSPDGTRISFVRKGKGESALYVISAEGGAERRLISLAFDPENSVRACWFSSSHLLVADRELNGPYCLFRVDVETGARTVLHQSPPESGDGLPRLSPDGRWIGFSRFFGASASDLFVMPATGGEARRITFDERPKREMRWAPDGKSMLYRSPKPWWRLWRTGVRGEAEKLVALPEAALGSFDLRPGPDGSLDVLIAQTTDRYSIWRSDRAANGAFQTAAPFITSSAGSLDVNPVISPDGLRIAFLSTRTGYPELWLADADGNNPVQLTTFQQRHVTVPAWTPDSKRLLSAARIDGSSEMFFLDARAGATPDVIRRPGVEDTEPQLSPDGRFITFSVKVDEKFQLFRMPAAGGTPVQITRNGCVVHRYSPDGQWIYLIRANEVSGLFRMPVKGGEDELVLDQVKSNLYRGWALCPRGIYYTAEMGGQSGWEIRFFDPLQKTHSPVLPIPFPLPRWSGSLSVGPGERWMVFPLHEPAGSRLMRFRA